MRPASINRYQVGARWRKWAACFVSVVLVILFGHVYFIQELMAAELILLAAFVFFSGLTSLCYLLGAAAERGQQFFKELPQVAGKRVLMKPVTVRQTTTEPRA